jgi:hypothetical protein
MAFDRIKPPPDRLAEPDADPEGRAALFSATGPSATAAALRCSRCGRVSPLDLATAVRSVLPLALVAPWREFPLFAVCPAGRHRAWLRPERRR